MIIDNSMTFLSIADDGAPNGVAIKYFVRPALLLNELMKWKHIPLNGRLDTVFAF